MCKKRKRSTPFTLCHIVFRTEALLLSAAHSGQMWDFSDPAQQEEFRVRVKTIFRDMDREYLTRKRKEFETWWENYGRHLPPEVLLPKRISHRKPRYELGAASRWDVCVHSYAPRVAYVLNSECDTILVRLHC